MGDVTYLRVHRTVDPRHPPPKRPAISPAGGSRQPPAGGMPSPGISVALPSTEDVGKVDPALLPQLVVQLAALLAAAGARLTVPAPVPVAERDDDLLDDQAVGQLLGVPASHVGDLRRRGVLPIVRVGKYVRVRRGDVRDFARGASHGPYASGIRMA